MKNIQISFGAHNRSCKQRYDVNDSRNNIVEDPKHFKKYGSDEEKY